jgi:hypothetical protein
MTSVPGVARDGRAHVTSPWSVSTGRQVSPVSPPIARSGSSTSIGGRPDGGTATSGRPLVGRSPMPQ